MSRVIRFAAISLLAASTLFPGPARAASVTVQIDRFGAIGVGGLGIVSGTITCDPDAILGADVHLAQDLGRIEIEGFEVPEFEAPCDGTPHSWAVGVRSNKVDRRGEYLFRGGPAFASIAIDMDTEILLVSRTVIIRGSQP
jgi:hypothetical protein